MSPRAAITVHRSREEIEKEWPRTENSIRQSAGSDLVVRFADAPGDRGTEIHVELRRSGPAGKVGELVEKVGGAAPLAKVKDELRRFKQQMETGEVPRSDGAPEGERMERKLKQRPAQPLADSELQKAGA